MPCFGLAFLVTASHHLLIKLLLTAHVQLATFTKLRHRKSCSMWAGQMEESPQGAVAILEYGMGLCIRNAQFCNVKHSSLQGITHFVCVHRCPRSIIWKRRPSLLNFENRKSCSSQSIPIGRFQVTTHLLGSCSLQNRYFGRGTS